MTLIEFEYHYIKHDGVHGEWGQWQNLILPITYIYIPKYSDYI